MNDRQATNRVLREGCLAFFGAITASLSHEINNVLAIVGELSGLLGDLTAAGRPPDPERLESIARRVGDQVDRGKGLVRRLNRFAHTVDLPVTELSVNETMELITTLCQRFATLRKSTLEYRAPLEEVTIESSSFGLMQAVYICIDLALGRDPETENTVSAGFTRTDDGGCDLVVTCSPPVTVDDTVQSRLDYLGLLMEDLGGTVVTSDPGRFVLHAPRKRFPGA